jgi:hypothetical protein
VFFSRFFRLRSVLAVRLTASASLMTLQNNNVQLAPRTRGLGICPHATGTRFQSISSTSFLHFTLSRWLAKCHLREWLGASTSICDRMSTPPAALFHVPSSSSWLFFTSTCYLQRLRYVPSFQTRPRVPMLHRCSLSTHRTEGQVSKRARAKSVTHDISSYPFWHKFPLISTGASLRLSLRFRRQSSCS